MKAKKIFLNDPYEDIAREKQVAEWNKENEIVGRYFRALCRTPEEFYGKLEEARQFYRRKWREMERAINRGVVMHEPKKAKKGKKK